jgi:hypothetical protein
VKSLAFIIHGLDSRFLLHRFFYLDLHPESPFLYLAFMRSECLLIAALLLTACGGRKMNATIAADAIAGIPGVSWEKKDVEITNIHQSLGSEAIAETRIPAAFRLEKDRGKWVVREVRFGQGQWETLGNIERALEMVRIEGTRSLLDRIAEAIRKYHESKGRLPVFQDYISLSDLLSPVYLDPLIRLDAWRRPLEAFPQDSKGILLQSAGPDGRFGTSDDISKVVAP